MINLVNKRLRKKKYNKLRKVIKAQILQSVTEKCIEHLFYLVVWLITYLWAVLS